MKTVSILSLKLSFISLVLSQTDKILCPGMIMSVNPKAPCYKIVSSPLNYSDALARCIIYGGQLVTTKNEFVNSFVQKTTNFLTGGKKIWLGANNLEVIWSWVDGERFSYANWAKNNPDHYNHCLAMDTHDGKWYSTGCFVELPFICEMGIP